MDVMILFSSIVRLSVKGLQLEPSPVTIRQFFFSFLCVSLSLSLVPTKLYDKNTISDYDTNLLPKYSISD